MDFKEVIKTCYSKSDFAKALGYHANGAGLRKAQKIIDTYSLDDSHFDYGKSKRLRYDRVEKECPVCGSFFTALKNHPKEKVTCSYACSNTYFKSGVNNPNWSNSNYRIICFEYHEKKCVVCGEEKIVSVHHLDEDHNNNDPKNLVPLCPTHHTYVHSQYKDEVSIVINDYLKNRWY